jgi:6,7-dimethyl-8-ribityllumazine synthase
MSQRETWPGEGLPVEDEVEELDPAEVEPDEVEEDDDLDDEPDEADPEEADEERDDSEDTGDEPALRIAGQHAAGELDVPDDIDLLEGEARDARRGVGIVVSRFNGEVVNRLLASALAELERVGVPKETITVMAVPGAFELPLGAMALAKTRRYSCIVALGCVIRGETAHFDYIAGEAASGLQLAALETGVPVSFGVLTVDTLEQAEARVDKGADAVRTALEMADLFAQLRATAQAK